MEALVSKMFFVKIYFELINLELCYTENVVNQCCPKQ